VEDTADALKAMVAKQFGLPATLESVFMKYTGKSLDDDLGDDDKDDDNE
jgi:hypothetical protein